MVTFNIVTQAVFDGRASKDGDAIYFVTDTRRIYRGSVRYTGEVRMVSSGNVITANSRLSATANNILSANADGLYVPAPTGKMDKVASSGAGQILVADSGGNASASGKTAGGAALSSTPSENVLATEAAVAAVRSGIQTTIAAIQTSLESKVDTSSITTTLNASNPSASKIPSESAVVAALTWRNLTV